MLLRISSLMCSAALILSGCSGRTTNGFIPTGGPAAASQGTIHSGAVTGRLVLHIPRRTRRAHYISPSTVAAAVTIAPATNCGACTAKFSLSSQLTPNASDCTVDSNTNGVTCAISFELKPGNYVGSIATYDGWNASTKKPAGNVLSENQSFPIGVTAGKANVAAITLSGIPHSIEVLALSTSDLTILPTGVYGYTRIEITPERTASMLAVALDADGNAIFGPGTPKFTVTVGGGYTSSVLGNNVLIHSPKTPSRGAWPITIATATCSTGGTCSTSHWTISAAPLLAIAQASTSSLTIYASSQTPTGEGSRKYAGIAASAGLSSPQAAVFDRNGNLFVANATGGPGHTGSITEYKPPYTDGSPTRTITNGVSGPSALAIAPKSGNLAVLNAGDSTVAVYAPGTTTPISAPQTATGITSIAFDSNDNLWYSTTGPGDVNELTVASSYASSGLNVGVGGVPSSMTLDGSGNLYVADSGSGSVTQYFSPTYVSHSTFASSITGSPQLIVDNTVPSQIRFSYGATFLGIAGTNTIDIYAPLSTQFYFNESDGAFQLQAFDQDGDLWVGPAGYPQGFGYLSWDKAGEIVDSEETQASAMAAFPSP